MSTLWERGAGFHRCGLGVDLCVQDVLYTLSSSTFVHQVPKLSVDNVECCLDLVAHEQLSICESLQSVIHLPRSGSEHENLLFIFPIKGHQ